MLLSGRGVDVPGYADETAALRADPSSTARTRCAKSRCSGRSCGRRWFAQNFSEGFFLEAILAGELRLPAGDGAASFVDAEDIAAVAVAALTEDGHAGQTYELSGPRALTIAEAVAEISEATGREVRYVSLSHEEFVAELIEQGWPAADAEDYADAVGPIRRGMDSHLSDGVQHALGRPARDFSEFVKTAAAAGAWQG